MSIDAAKEEGPGDVWQVKLASGEMRPMTLTQLDDAFQESTVNADTYVLQAGTTTWAKLGDVAGIGASGESPIEAKVAPVSEAPVAFPIDMDDSDDEMMAGLRPRKRGRILWGMAAAALVLGGIGFAATRSPDAPPAPVAAAVAPPPAATPIPPVPAIFTPAPEPVPPPKAEIAANAPESKSAIADPSKHGKDKAKTSAPSRKSKTGAVPVPRTSKH